jgi:hypothetical protein
MNPASSLGDNPSIERQLQSVQLLTRAPDRFSAAQLTPSLNTGFPSAAIDLLAWSGLCGWMNRLKIALGMFVSRRKMLKQRLLRQAYSRKNVSRSFSHENT